MGLFAKIFKPTVVNPANGQVMPGGRGGYDMSGNLYGQNKSTHATPHFPKHTAPHFPKHTTPHFPKHK